MFINQLENDIGFRTLEYVTPSTLKHFTLLINSVNLKHCTKNSKKVNDYKSEIVNNTSIYNFLKVQKNWHPPPIFNNISMNRNPWLIVQSDDFITTYWNEFNLMDQNFSLLQITLYMMVVIPTHLNMFDISSRYWPSSRNQKCLLCSQNKSWVCYILIDGNLPQIEQTYISFLPYFSIIDLHHWWH